MATWAWVRESGTYPFSDSASCGHTRLISLKCASGRRAGRGGSGGRSRARDQNEPRPQPGQRVHVARRRGRLRPPMSVSTGFAACGILDPFVGQSFVVLLGLLEAEAVGSGADGTASLAGAVQGGTGRAFGCAPCAPDARGLIMHPGDLLPGGAHGGFVDVGWS